MTRPAARWRAFQDDAGALTLLLLVTTASILVMPALEDLGVIRASVVEGTDALTLLVGLLAVAGSRPKLGALGGLLVVQQIIAWAPIVDLPPAHRTIWMAAIAALFCLLLATFLIGDISRGRSITRRHIEGAIATYLLIGTGFAFAYRALSVAAPGAFMGTEGTPATDHPQLRRLGYFSIVTLTTVGYGDIVPVHPVARSLALAEALVGQLFPAILLARLVSLEIEGRRSRS